MSSTNPPLQGQPASPRELAARALAGALGVENAAALEHIAEVLTRRYVRAGETVFLQGDTSDQLYFVASGRLQVLLNHGLPDERLIGEVVRGETAGEAGVIAGLPRSATVRAVRDSELLALSRANLEALVQAHPTISFGLARQLAHHLSSNNRPSVSRKHPHAIAVVNLVEHAAGTEAFARQLTQALSQFGSAFMATREGAGELRNADADPGRFAAWLDELESQHKWLVLPVPDGADEWGRACLRQCDEVLWLGDATQPAKPQLATLRSDAGLLPKGVAGRLVLTHPARRSIPQGTAAWVRSGSHSISHLREGKAADFQRLARTLAGQSVGLVFSGGGARGFSHIGVFKALWEAGVPVDAVSGTSMGAAVASFVALGYTPEELIDRFHWIFNQRPTSDYNLLPLISLVTGRRLRGILERTYRAPDGSALGIEDCWKPFHCVVSNFSQSQVHAYRNGPLATLVRASMALPGFLPPVFHEGHALIDGGVFNNLPTDVLRSAGVRHIVAVDLRIDPFGPAPEADIPSAYTTLAHWWRTRGPGRGRARIPSLRELLVRLPTLSSDAHQAHAAGLADVLFHPDVADVGIVDWSALDRAIERGYRHAREQIEAGRLDSLIALGQRASGS